MSERDVAVVGMACTFPRAPDLRTYWRNVVNGVDAIRTLPADRWPGCRLTDLPSEHPAHVSCDRGGFVDTPLRFASQRFGVMPNVSRHGDPDQFLLLDIVDRALRDAGLGADDPRRGRTDLIVGRGGYVSNTMLEVFLRSDGVERIATFLRARAPELDHERVVDLAREMRATLPPLDVDAMASSIPNLVASRAANRLDLGGAAYTVDAACASSLVAIEHAVDRLRSGRADVVVAAGVNLTQVPAFWYLFTNILAVSRSGKIRPFDSRADGMLIGEGAGAVVLTRSADATRHDHRAYAVVRGTGTSSDGRARGVLAPDTGGQVRALLRAYEDAAVDPATIGFVEAHGTGTNLGDAAELATLAEVFGPPRARYGSRPLGAVKSMIGHTMPAAGLAAFVKTALALSRRTIPPTLHCEQPHPALAETDFFVNGRPRPWLHAPGTPRRAGVNAFGFGGTNAHVVLEEVARTSRTDAGPVPRLHECARRRPTELFTFAADDDEALSARLRECSARLRDVRDPTDATEVARHLHDDGPVRLALVREARPALADELDALADRAADGTLASLPSDGAWFHRDDVADAGSSGQVAAVFPGIAFPGLVGEFPDHVFENCLHFPRVLDVFDLAERRDEHPDDPLPTSFLLVPPQHVPHDERVRMQARFGLVEALATDDDEPPEARPDTRNLATMGMLATNQAGWAVLREDLGVDFDMLCGQSLGDVSAVIAGGMVEFESSVPRFWDLFRLEVTPAQTGCVAIVGGSEDDVAPLLPEVPDVTIGLHLSPTTLIVGGPHEQIDRLCTALRRRRVLAQRLPYPAIHTPRMEEIQRSFTLRAGTPDGLRRASLPLYSGVLGGRMPEDPDLVRDVLEANVSRPIRFWQTIRRMYDDGARVFVQVGLGTIASNSAAVLDESDAVCVAMDVAHRHPLTQVQRLCGELFARGVPFDRGGLFAALPPAAPPATAASDDVHLTLYWPPLHVDDAAPGMTPGHAPGGVDASPFAGSVVEHVDGVRRTTSVALRLDEHRYLADHAMVGGEGLKPLSERLPVVPLTMLLEIVAQGAAPLAPGLALTGFADVRALRWIAFEEEEAVQLTVHAHRIDDEPGTGCTRVQVEVLRGEETVARAVALLGSRYTATIACAFTPLDDAQPLPARAEDLYAERFLFHGPAFRCLRTLGVRGEGTVTGELAVLPQDRLFASTSAPTLLTDPVVLDGAGQLLGAYFVGSDGYVLPVAVDRVELYRPRPPVGSVLPARVQFTEIDRTARRTSAQIEVEDGAGHVWMRVDGWQDVVMNWSPALVRSTRRPDRHTLARPISLLGAPADAVAVLLDASDLADAQDEWLARGWLGHDEWGRYLAAGIDAETRRPWLSAAIAGKDACRLLAARDAGREELEHPMRVPLRGGVAVASCPEGTVAVAGERPPRLALVARDGAPDTDDDALRVAAAHALLGDRTARWDAEVLREGLVALRPEKGDTVLEAWTSVAGRFVIALAPGPDSAEPLLD